MDGAKEAVRRQRAKGLNFGDPPGETREDVRAYMFRDDRIPASGDRPFVFRAEQCASLGAKLSRTEGARVITVVGPGGTGKSRLLQWAAGELVGGARTWVSLASANGVDGVVAAFARALGLEAGSEEAARASVRAFLAGGDPAAPAEPLAPQWVFLDDAEGARGALCDLLSAPTAAHLRFLVSSREPLGLVGEDVLAVGGLTADEAVALFRMRVAGAPMPDETWIREFTGSLDGSPLAIEIAASWLSVLSPDELRARFSNQLPRAGAEAPASLPRRHTTLGDAVQGSWDLLSDAAREALLSLSAFPDGFSLSLAERACASPNVLPVLDELRRRSLLRRDTSEDGRPRFHFYRAVLEFAASRPEAVAPLRIARAEEAVLSSPEETENLWAVVRRESDPERVARAALILHPGLLGRGPFAAHLPLLLRAESLSRVAETQSALGVALAEVYRMRGDLDALAARLSSLKSLSLSAALAAQLRRLEGWLSRMRGDLPEAVAHYEAAMAGFRSLGDTRAVAVALGELAFVRQSAGDPEGALVLHRRALEIHRASGDRRQSGIELSYIAVATHRLGRMREALGLHDEARAIHLEVGNPRYAAAEEMHRAYVLFELGDLTGAREAYGTAIAAHQKVRDAVLEALSHVGLSHVERERGGEAGRRAAAESLARAENLLENVRNARMSAAVATARGHLYLDAGSYAEALAAYDAARAASREVVAGPEALTDSYRALALAALGEAGPAEEAAKDAVTCAAQVKNPCILQAASAARDGILGLLSDPRLPEGAASSDLRRISAWFRDATRRGAGDPGRGPRLTVGPDVRWFALEGVRMDLARRAAIRRIFQALLARLEQAPGTALGLEAVIEAGWPGERMRVEAAQKRAYTAIWTLRTQALGEHLLTRDDGYLLDPALRVQRLPPEA
jgi:tetratricopeptide (TPR) repeat protein